MTISYTYDALDRRTSMSDSLGGTTTYAYDFEDRLSDLTAPWGTVYSFGYDGQGRRTSLTSTSGRNTSYGYTNGLLTALSHAQSGVALTDLGYSYGVDGQLTAIIDNLDPTKSLAINYDDLNRLVQVDQGDPAGVTLPIEDYAYDGEGNRLASHLSSLYSSNDHNQLLEDDSYTYAYDERGNRTSRTAKSDGAVETYSYDSQNRLIGYVSDTITASYAYDALERRIAKTVNNNVGTFVYDTAPDGSLSTDDILIEWREALSRRWLHTFAVDEPIAFEDYRGNAVPGSGQSYELFSNRLNSVEVVVDTTTGETVAAYRYNSFGQRITAGSVVQPFGFTGREHDNESGLIYLRARYMDPHTGLFIHSDPVGFQGEDLNIYAYVGNDPWNLIDPNGLTAQRGGTSTTETSILSKAMQEAREEAIISVAEGVFGLVGYIIGSFSYMDAALTVVDNVGGSHLHHCDPRYLTGDPKKGALSRISAGRHVFLHRAMRVYLRAFKLDWAPGRSGDIIRSEYAQKYIREVTQLFYRDMREQFKMDFGC